LLVADFSKFDPEHDEVLSILRAGLLFQESEDPDEEKCIAEFMHSTNDAYKKGQDTIQLSWSLVSRIRSIFERRNRRPGRQTKSFRAQLVEDAVIAHARAEKYRLMQEGCSTGDAQQRAAERAAARLGHLGISLSANTIFRRMESTGKKSR